MMRFPSSSSFALAVGVLGSGAANVAWTWELGPVRVAAGLFATALVPISLHLWPRVPVTGRVTRVVRALVMTYICVAAALVNLAHSAQLLTTAPGAPRPRAEDLVLAILLITAVEAVMVMATLAKRAPRPRVMTPEQQLALLIAVSRMAAPAQKRPLKQQPRRAANPPAPAVAAPKPAEPARPALHSVPPAGDREEKLAKIVAKGGGRDAVVKELGVTPYQARTMLEEFKKQATS